MRLYKKYELSDDSDFSNRLLAYLKDNNRVAFLNSNQLDKKYGSYDFLCGFDVVQEFIYDNHQSVPSFKRFVETTKDWMFGFLSYDFKNELENLISAHYDGIQMPLIHFFQPKLVLLKKDNMLEIGYLHEFHTAQQVDDIYNAVCNIDLKKIDTDKNALLETVCPKVKKQDYLNKIKIIKEHIQKGDIYEMNFCIEFYAKYNFQIDVFKLYRKLNKLSPAPFSCLYVMGDKSLVCASPERFLKKEGHRLISQPIKGTAKRGATPDEDVRLAQELKSNEKEKSENVMIVDLVRNDLSHLARKGSVKVEELFGIYSYAQVHQMISTVVSELKEDASPVDALMQCFPPGSMTGAPKIRAMQIIEAQERTKRGLYAGAVGYFTPEKDFDFNVVIRSILINNKEQQVSLMAGGAITAESIADKEYKECLIKASAMMMALTQEE